MRTRIIKLAAVTAVLGLGAGIAAGATADDGPTAPVPRVCWFSDYENAKLSNRCEYRSDERRWYIDVDGESVPADEQELPVANLCLYFHGTSCPGR
jgi:hypothetical protein